MKQFWLERNILKHTFSRRVPTTYDIVRWHAFFSKLWVVFQKLLPFVRPWYGRQSTYLWWNVIGEVCQGEDGEQGDALAPSTTPGCRPMRRGLLQVSRVQGLPAGSCWLCLNFAKLGVALLLQDVMCPARNVHVAAIGGIASMLLLPCSCRRCRVFRGSQGTSRFRGEELPARSRNRVGICICRPDHCFQFRKIHKDHSTAFSPWLLHNIGVKKTGDVGDARGADDQASGMESKTCSARFQMQGMIWNSLPIRPRSSSNTLVDSRDFDGLPVVRNWQT